MKCFGDKTKTFHVKVVLLDEQELIQEVQETTSGQNLLDIVFQHLNLLETSYFGLRYIDPSNQTHWLDPNKRLSKQLKGASPYTLYFSVKFYAADPTKLVEEITRYQFFLQVKQDILQGRLPVSPELTSELGSYAVQSELGDYDPRRHSPGYVSEFRFNTSQSVDLENKIAELHKKLQGFVPSKAEICYLEKVKWLDMYGVDLHPVLGVDSTEYFLGLTPSGIIVLRNKAKVGNYFWPRITKVYFRGKSFMLRVKDKNNTENTYGFETPSKSACKHLWQCCVEHHAFFRLTQAAGNNPQAMFSIGSNFRYSGRTEKEALSDAKQNARPQTEFARTPSRRYQRRIVEGAQDTPRVEDLETKPETRTIVSLPGSVTPVSSHVYRSTSMTLAPRSDSPRSTRSAPHPSGLKRNGMAIHNNNNLVPGDKRDGRPTMRGESPRSVKSASAGRAVEISDRITRRTSSVESQSSVDSRSCHRSCSRHRRSRCRSSDGESEASSKCSSSKGHRRHHHKHHRRHRHHSDDSSEHHKRRHRRHRRRSSEREEPQLIESGNQWARVQSGTTPSKSNTATVRNLTSGYMPSGHEDTEVDPSIHHHSSRRKHRKHRSRSRSPSEQKHKGYPDEIRRHIEFNLKNTSGLTEAQLKEIPYTKVETAKAVKVKYGSPKGKRQKSPKRSKSNSSDRKNAVTLESPYSEQNSYTKGMNGHSTLERDSNTKENDIKLVNGSLRPYPRSSQVAVDQNTHTDLIPHGELATSPHFSPSKDSSHPKNYQEVGTLQRGQKEKLPLTSPLSYGPNPSSHNGSNTYSYNNQMLSTQDQRQYNTSKTNNFNSNNKISGNSQYRSLHPNLPSEGAFQQHPRDSNLDYQEEEEEMSSGFIDSNSGGFMNHSPTLIKNATLERGSHFTSVLKPQPSPQSSVTSGISVGSSSVSISNDSSLTRSSRSLQPSSINNDYPSPSQSQDLTPPSSSPDPELHSYYDKPVTPTPRVSLKQNSEPFYINSKASSRANCPVHHNHVGNPSQLTNHYANEDLTQHSTNILIQYHDGNSSSASSGYKTPTPTPRSSIISSIHSSEASTHIVQSYGPAYANSHMNDSLKKPLKPVVPPRPSSSMSTNSLKSTIIYNPNLSPANYSHKKVEGHNFSSLPRKPRGPTLTKNSSSQTNLHKRIESQQLLDQQQLNQPTMQDKNVSKYSATTDSIKPKTDSIDTQTRTFTNRPLSASNPLHNNSGLILRDGKENHNHWQRGTNQCRPVPHWKVFNWNTGKNEEAWYNSLDRQKTPPEILNEQQASATMKDNREDKGVAFQDGVTAFAPKFHSHHVNGIRNSETRNNEVSVSIGIPDRDLNRTTDKVKPIIIMNGHLPKQKLNNLHNGFVNHTDKGKINDRNKNWENQTFMDHGYHTLEKRTNNHHVVNLRNHYDSNNKKVNKYRPNSFSYDQKPYAIDSHFNNELKSSNLRNDNPKNCKPILKSFSSEDNLSSSLGYDPSIGSENLIGIPLPMTNQNNKNRVRWNLQEKSKNIINMKEVPRVSAKPCDYNSLAKAKHSGAIHQNVKNDVVYAGSGDIIQIKNNQIINIKTTNSEQSSQPATSFCSKKKFFRDEISTEL